MSFKDRLDLYKLYLKFVNVYDIDVNFMEFVLE